MKQTSQARRRRHSQAPPRTTITLKHTAAVRTDVSWFPDTSPHRLITAPGGRVRDVLSHPSATASRLGHRRETSFERRGVDVPASVFQARKQTSAALVPHCGCSCARWNMHPPSFLLHLEPVGPATSLLLLPTPSCPSTKSQMRCLPVQEL